ncbi:MAG: 30S ribosome-binding factor RbfA [Candidatus Omnitrophica bacterium]|nr:30S ribosome-binding factor RbfA [Candidatus Omnitrophota bacterium]MBU1870280.1 30S ribosome-binding factor RbfA [Candidatus Omnitrophota bacterium]
MSRQERVAEAIKKEVSLIVHDELKDPRLGFVTIVRAEITHDLRYAKVFFSVLGNEEQYEKTQEALDSAQGYIRKLVSEKINLRFSPEIIFRPDKSAEYSVKIQQVLEEIKGLEKPVEKKKAKPKTRKKVRGEPKKSGRVRKKI